MGTGRIYDEIIDINENEVKEFFEERAKREMPHRYNYSIYQDDNPELALKRDKYEKELISSLINFKENSYILDIGCGVGRWGDAFVSKNIKQYVGVDISEEFLNIARASFATYGNKFAFIKADFKNVIKVLSEYGLRTVYDYIFVNGVFLYINDSDVMPCLSIVDDLMASGGIVYIKDAIALETRLTLNSFQSKELKSSYSAIYRPERIWDRWINQAFPDARYQMVKKGPIWPEDLHNRKETKQYYWIIENIE